MERKYPLFPLWELNGYGSSFEQTWTPSLVEIGPVVLEISSMYFRYFVIISP